MSESLPTQAEVKQCAIIGISMLNSHFTRANIQRTAEQVRGNYERICFMLPDTPAIHTLVGYGYTPDEAASTAKRKFRPLHKNCRASIEALGIENACIMQWERLAKLESYQSMLLRLNGLYESDARFRDDARTMTRGVYEHSQFPKKKDMSLDEQTDAGIPFLLEELSFIVRSPEILGVGRTEYLYHRAMPILSDLLIGKYNFTAPENVSFKVLEEEA